MIRVIDNHRTELSPIPAGWSHARMKVAIKKYQSKKNQDENSTVLSLTKTGLRIKTDLSFGKSTESYVGHQIVNKGQFVFTPRDFDATPILCGVSDYDGCISNLYIVFDVSDKIYPKYLEYYFYGLKYGFNYFEKLSFGMRYSFNKTQFEHIPLIYPDYSEQKKIADFLGRETARIDELIERKAKLIGVLEEKRSFILNKTVREGISTCSMDEPNFFWLSKVPSHWRIERLRHIGAFQNGISEGADYFGSGFPFVGYGDVYRNSSLPQALSGLAKSSLDDQKRYSVERGDIFFTRTSEVAEEIGFSSVCLETIEKATFSGFLIRFRPDRNVLLPEYSKYYFRSDIPRFFFVKEMNLVTRVSLGQNLLKNLPILLPPLDEQKSLALYLDEWTERIDKIILKEKLSIKKLKEMKSSLITATVTGQLDIQAWRKRGQADRCLGHIEEEIEQKNQKSKKASA